jgi:hydroxymethylglutaryl-CoA lyase
MQDLGCNEIDIADTIGVGTARQVQTVFDKVSRQFPIDQLAGHFHDTYGQALANIYAALEVGVSIYHSSVAGLGGCPYAKGATGNVATEDVLYLMQGLGIQTGIDLQLVVDAGQFISQHLGRKAVSRAGNAIAARHAAQS